MTNYQPLTTTREPMRDRFARDTTAYMVVVQHDDRLWRNIHVQMKNSTVQWFELSTTPGTLVFCGDGDSFVFRGEPDMFDYFRHTARDGQPSISAWANRLTGGRKQALTYDQDLLAAHAQDAITEYYGDEEIPEGLEVAVQEEVLDELVGSLDLDRNTVGCFRWWKNPQDQMSLPVKRPDFEFVDIEDWRIWSYEWWFEWACHAILWGIGQYDDVKRETAQQVNR